MWELWYCALAAVNAAGWIIHIRRTRRLMRGMREEILDSRGRDEKIFRLYQDIEGMLDSFEAYVGETHSELELRRGELLELSRQAAALYTTRRQPATEPLPAPPPPPAPRTGDGYPDRTPKKDAPPADTGKLSGRDRQELAKIPGKGGKIRFLMGKGLSVGEVARELGIGKGEVMLIVDLDK